LTVPSTFSIILQLPIIYLLCNPPDGADFTEEKRDNPSFFRSSKDWQVVIFTTAFLNSTGGNES